MPAYYKKPAPPKPKRGLPWLKIGLNTVILGGLLYLAVSFYPILSMEAGYYLSQWSTSAEPISQPTASPTPGFNALLREGPALRQTPVNTDFSVVIDKINVNTPVVA